MSTSDRDGNPAAEAHVHLSALGVHLKAHGFTVDPVAGGITVRNPSAPGWRVSLRIAQDTITCAPRKSDSGRYWYFTSWRQPIAEADRITDALMAIKAYLGAPT